MHNALHPKYDVGSLYVSRKEGGTELASTEDIVDVSIQQLKDYMQKSGGRLTAVTRNSNMDKRTSGMIITRRQKLEEKNFTDILSDK